jgi:hypothetical protein
MNDCDLQQVDHRRLRHLDCGAGSARNRLPKTSRRFRLGPCIWASLA